MDKQIFSQVGIVVTGCFYLRKTKFFTVNIKSKMHFITTSVFITYVFKNINTKFTIKYMIFTVGEEKNCDKNHRKYTSLLVIS